jgi:4-hydroxybenzoate polyprenyltransferase
MFAMRYAVIAPVYTYFGIPVVLSKISFMFLVLSVIFLASAGNVINDYFDRRADMINRPDNVLVVFSIRRRQTIIIHAMFSIFGIICGFIVSNDIGKTFFGWFFIFAVIILWLYSANFKRRALIGNITASFFVALIPFSVGIFEFYAVRNKFPYPTYETISASEIALYMILGFSVFAFIYNFILVVAKDCENYEGDKLTGRKTIPVRIGKRKTNWILGFMSLISVILVFLTLYLFLPKVFFLNNEKICVYYIFLFIIVPAFVMAIVSFVGTQKRKYAAVEMMTKFIMLFGILFSLIFNHVVYGFIQ